MKQTQGHVDFALSYAGEDVAVAHPIAEQLRTLGFQVFVAEDLRSALVGEDGEAFFKRLFSEAKQVVVFISEHYRAKDWTRFEWDVIRRRDLSNRFIPVRLDDTQLIGMPTNYLCVEWTGSNLADVIETCVERLLLFEKDQGLHRESLYEAILDEIKNRSRGATAKAFQLVKDGRKRTPLEDAPMPDSDWEPSYKVVQSKWHDVGVVRRRMLRVTLPPKLIKEEVVYNLEHCCISEFNAWKPDAISVDAHLEGSDLLETIQFAVLEYAPWGDWGRAEEGYAYNIPTSEFEFRIIELGSYPYA